MGCPHCLTAKTGFTALREVPIGHGQAGWLMFLQCRSCGEAVIATTPGSVGHWISGQTQNTPHLIRMYPAPRPLAAPADVPEGVAKAYISGLINLPQPEGQGLNAAAAMFRRAVELAVKALNPEGKGDLYHRIEALDPDHATPAMKKWAHRVRLAARDAVHDDGEFSEAEAHELRAFAELFLTYAFTLPAMLAKAKGAAGG